jgi:hypothetical protein
VAVRASEEKEIGDAGELAVALAFKRMGWGVAPNPDDVGTDLFVMARDRRWDLGLLAGVQVKTSRSGFQSVKRDPAGVVVGWWFRDRDRDHVDAWVRHALPHLLVLHDLTTGTSCWVHITADAIESTGKGVRILVPTANTVDAAHRDVLLRIAATVRPPTVWEGTAWTGVASLPPGERLRYALIAPRLIAPHPNLILQAAPTPEQTVAMLLQVRLQDLDEYRADHPDLPSPEVAAASPLWLWRFVGALAHRVTTGDSSTLRALVHDAPDPAARTAAAVAAAAGLFDDDRPDEAITLLREVLAGDDTDPVDTAWLRVQYARACAEVGRVDEARTAAARALTIGLTHSADITATAIGGIAASLLFRTSDWGAEDLAGMISSADTTVSWWQTSTTSSGLSALADRTFRHWARDTSQRWTAGDPANDPLFAASMMANHLGDHSRWRHLTRLLGHDALLRLDRAAPAPTAAGGLTQLRLSGDRPAVTLAVHHIAVNGPAAAVSLALAAVDLPTSTHTTGPANLALLEGGGDLADAETADRAVTWLLQTLIDPVGFTQRTTPTYLVDHYLLRALAGVIPAAAPAQQRHLAAQIAALVDVDDQTRATDWGRVVDALAVTAWDTDSAHLAGLNAGGHYESLRWPLLRVSARFDPTVRDQLIDDARGGSSAALSALGDVRDLPADLVESVITRLTDRVAQQINKAHQGTYSDGAHATGHDLVIFNIWYPVLAHWDPLCDLLADHQVSGAHKRGALRSLASSTDRLPDDLRPRLTAIAVDAVRNPGLPDPFIGPAGDATAAAAELLAALDPDRGNEQLVDLLAGDPSHRESAARVARHLNRPEGIGVLVALARDPEPAVRATAAAALASLVAVDQGGRLAAAALDRCADDPGCSVPISLAAALSQESTRSPATNTVLGHLRYHRSAAVRRWVATATTTD